MDIILKSVNSPTACSLFIDGPPGIGKSSLLANWELQFRKQNPQRNIITHYVGSSPESTELGLMISRIMKEMKIKLGISRKIPHEKKTLIETFPEWLSEASHRGLSFWFPDI